jgi:hypothetical protein
LEENKGANVILKVKEKDGKELVDIEWLRAMTDEQLQETVTNVHDARKEAQTMFLDMRDAMLTVLVKHNLCPAHWLRDGCPIEVWGTRGKIDSQFELFQKKLIKENLRFQKKWRRWEQSVEYQAWLRRNKDVDDEESNDKTA